MLSPIAPSNMFALMNVMPQNLFGKPVRYVLFLNIAIFKNPLGLLVLVSFDITCTMLVGMVKWLSHLLVAQTSLVQFQVSTSCCVVTSSNL